ncbi:MAG: basic amino acid ABC transporter substrate-binding protein [Oscillospiraceae bacterium]|jgi:polar amino acid transport system substrate-binding protein|nr:basic amino acid ABC transporter substrate-binding protein [Oscillospiraceae bacterium]
MKKITLFLALLLLLTLTAGCAGSSAADPGSSAEPASPAAPVSADEPDSQAALESAGGGLEGKTALIMGTEAGFAPYEYYDDSGAVTGVDPDIAKAIAEAMGLELQIEEMDFDAIIPEIQAGRIDFGAAGMTVTDERSQQVDFSIPYATSRQIIVVKEGNAEITGPDSLAGKNVGVQLGTVADIVLTDEYSDTTVGRYKKYFEAFADLEAGRLDAIAMDVLPAQEFLSQNQGLVILEQELMIDEYAIAVQKGNTELLDAINAHLTAMISDGTIDQFTLDHTVSE